MKKFEEKTIPSGIEICEIQLLHLATKIKDTEVDHCIGYRQVFCKYSFFLSGQKKRLYPYQVKTREHDTHYSKESGRAVGHCQPDIPGFGGKDQQQGRSHRSCRQAWKGKRQEECVIV